MTARARLAVAGALSVGLLLFAWVGWRAMAPPVAGGVTPPSPRSTAVSPIPAEDWLKSDAPLPPLTHRGRQADRQEGPIRHIAYSPDGRTLATASTEEVWEQLPNQEVATVRAFDVVQLSDARSGEVRLLLEPLAGTVRALAFSPDSRVMAVASGQDHPRRTGQLTLWNTVTGQRVRTVEPLADPVSAVAFHPDGRSLVFACAGCITRWDLGSHTGYQLRADAALRHVTAVAFNADGSRLVVGGAESLVEWQFPAGTFTVRPSPIKASKWDGGLTFGRDDKTPMTAAARWETVAERKLALPPSISAAAVSPDGKRVAWVDDEKWHDDEFGFVWTTPRLRVADTADLGHELTWEGNLKRLTYAEHRATRLEAIRWLKENAKHPQAKTALPVLAERLKSDTDWRVREKAACRLVLEMGLRYKDDPFPLALLTAFRDPDRCVRVAARFRLTEPKSYPLGAIDELLKSAVFPDSFEGRAEAVWRLSVSFKDDPRALKAITSALTDPHPVVRQRAHRAHYQATSDLAPLIRYWLRYTDGTDIEWPEDFPVESDDFEIEPDRRRAMRNLYRFGFAGFTSGVTSERPTEVAAEMIKLLDDPAAEVRVQVADRVGMFGRSVSEKQAFEAVIPPYLLVEREKHGQPIPDDLSTLRGSPLLTQLLKQGVTGKLLEMAKSDPDDKVRSMAAFALDRLHPSPRK